MSSYNHIKLYNLAFIQYIVKVFAIITLMFGCYSTFMHYSSHLNQLINMKDKDQVTSMYVDIGNYSINSGLPSIVFSADQIRDYFGASVLQNIYYEQEGIILNAKSTVLGGSIFAIDRDTALKTLSDSNIIVLNLESYLSSSPYPFDQTIRPLHHILIQNASKQFIILSDYNFAGYHYRVYVKPDFKVNGLSDDGWITADGLNITVPGSVANQTSKIILEGSFTPHSKLNTKIITTLVINGEGVTELPSQLSVNYKTNRYSIVIAIPNNRHYEESLHLSLRFLKYFNSKDVGVNNGIVNLFFRAPDVRRVVKINNNINQE